MNELNKRTPQKDFSIAEFFAEVYKNVGAGLAVTSFTSWMMSYTKLVYLIWNFPAYLMCVSVCTWAMYSLQRNMSTMTLNQGRAWYGGIAVIEGVLLSPFVVIYTNASIVTIFGMTSMVFLVASHYGATTGDDLTTAHAIAHTILRGVFMVLAVQFALYFLGFLGLQALSSAHWLYCIFIAIFTPVCIAGTSQELSEIYYRNPDAAQKMAIVGALHLFMHFINLFLALLRLFGSRRDER